MAIPVTVFTLCMGLTSLPSGLMADRLGPAKIVNLYLWAAAFGAVMCWAAPGLVTFTLAQALLGAAVGLYHPSGLGLISLAVERRSLGKAMGLHGMAGPVGMAVAPIAMLAAARAGSWRTGFLGLAAAFAVCAVAGHVLRGRGLVFDGTARREPAAAGEQGVLSPPVLLLVAVVGVNAFLLDGFAVMFPETVARHGVFVWNLETVLFSILAMGALGQFVGGLIAGGPRGPTRYVWVVACQPVLLIVTGLMLDAAMAPYLLLSGFAFFNFMTQPLENSMLAAFTARARRSTVYAVKFLVGLVIGAPAAVIGIAIAEARGFATAWIVFGVLGFGAVVLALVFRRVHAARAAAT
jgi:MFS family permease